MNKSYINNCDHPGHVDMWIFYIMATEDFSGIDVVVIVLRCWLCEWQKQLSVIEKFRYFFA